MDQRSFNVGKLIMPSRKTDSKTAAGDKGKTKFAERKRVLKPGSDGDVVRAFAKKRSPK